MRPIKEDQQAHARSLYFQTGYSRADIADAVGVSEKTIYLWTKQGDWQRLRSASRIMPSMVVEHFYYQIQELNETIAAREFGKRYPTPQEAETFRKLSVTINRMKTKSTQGETMQTMQTFMAWLLPQNLELTKTFTPLADRFIKSQSIAGFHPYDMEYEEPTLFKPHKHEPLPNSEQPDEVPPHNPNQLSLFPDDTLASLRGTKQPHEMEGGQHGSLAPDEAQPEPPFSPSLREAPGPEAPAATKQSSSEVPDAAETQDIAKQETIGNNYSESYDAPTATPSDNPSPEQEITPEEKTGNNPRPKKKKPKPEMETKYLGRRGEIDWANNPLPPGAQLFSVGDAIYYMLKKE